VKVLKPGLSHDPRWEKRFQRELRLGRPIRHPNVCRIFDIADDTDGYRFLTMEYATGGTLRDLVKTNQPLRPLAERLADAAGVIAGLAAIHGAGIVHRDVKPDNMLRMDDGRLVLSDFGLATDLPDSTMVSVFVGTPHYMAPEVREGDPATTRSDVWSLGVVLHEIFFGKRPEKRSARSMSGVSKSSTTATSSIVERAMLALCTRCLSDDPLDRPEDARAVEKIFESARRSPYAILRQPRRRVASLSLAALALVVAAAIGLKGRRQASTVATDASVGVRRLVPTGEPKDWTNTARALTTIPAHVHCFSMSDPKTVRLIWGTPRTAEDVDVATGARKPSKLLPATFEIGCPESTRDGSGLLFTAQNQAGAKEVRLSHHPDGTDATSITPGAEPLWIGDGEEFVYNIDAAHVAVYSLATMSFSLLSDPGLGGRQMAGTGSKAVSRGGELVAVLFADDKAQRAVSIYDARVLARRATFMVPQAYEIQFAPQRDDLLVAYQLSASFSTLASLNWKAQTFEHVGHYPGRDIVNVYFSDDAAVVLARRRTNDVWLHDRESRRRLTFDGQNFSAAISPSGRLLLSKRTEDGGVSLWLQEPRGTAAKVTPGPSDVEPDFSPDGKAWAYADYAHQTIAVCDGPSTCRVLVHDERLPSRPKFSPDGTMVGFVTQMNPSRLMAVPVLGGAVLQLGEAYGQCTPVWTSPTRIWGFEGSAGKYFWSERDVATGVKTGKRLPVPEGHGRTDEIGCWPRSAEEGSPFFQRLRVETDETSSVTTLPVALLD
jgi:hypothetical protein